MTFQNLKRAFLVLPVGLMCLAFSQPSLAQDSYIWEDYGIGFSVAEDMLIEESNADTFTVVSSDGEIVVNISPWVDGSVDEETLADAAIEMAVDLYYIDDSELDGNYIDIDSFSGYYILAAPGDIEATDFMLFALLLDTESDTNLIVAIGFAGGNEDEAVEILESLYSY